ncbi:MAG: endonuclease/exonuclease/phosphatase family protein [Planctomycetaceae bacterium]
MKRLFRVLILSIVTMVPAAVSQAEEPAQLRVLSYNIHHAEGVDRKLDLERIAKVIPSVKPDVVALQEVDQNVKRTGSIDQPEKLARLTEMNVIFGANIELQGGHYGNAVLSRFPIARHKNHLLPNIDNSAALSKRKSKYRKLTKRSACWPRTWTIEPMNANASHRRRSSMN